MSVVDTIKQITAEAIKNVFSVEVTADNIAVNITKPEFEGDYTVVLFSLVKQLRKAPDVAGNELGNYLLKNYPALFKSFNVIKGFLNLVIADSYWIEFLQKNYNS